jgi:NAD(P)-dependent dehydrogenase (short-subunit alcohol dehydrogenase family)
MTGTDSQKVALITGTSSGIGLQAAVQLAQAGFRVVATMRDPGKDGALQDAARQAGVTVEVRALDIEDADAITACVAGVQASYGRIDLLVNNAGAGYVGALEQTSPEALRRTMEINFFGVWRMVQAVFPLMRVAGAGRIITVTSIGGLIAQPFNDAYCAAKFAVEGFMESLAPLAQRLGISVSLIEPGAVNTGFVAAVRETSAPLAPELQAAYGPLLDAYIAASMQVFSTVGQTPADVGAVIVEAATSATPHFRYPSSDMIRGLIGRKYVDPTGDSVLALSGARLP